MTPKKTKWKLCGDPRFNAAVDRARAKLKKAVYWIGMISLAVAACLTIGYLLALLCKAC